ncbi:MAG: PilZ domain-containing protein [Candidatus Electrothrix sp. GW3-4]|uniref:PilZ domain-containing protein n=1 Tax=Candidatus Electrothrix sp. GW3-4 TaxID=3126740 RepID=UPI0030D57615
MTAYEQKIEAFERSLQMIEECVQNGSLHVPERSFHALYNTYEMLVDMSPFPEELRIIDFMSRKVTNSRASSKNLSLPDAIHEETEKRLYQRIQLDGYTADIIQGGCAYTASVQDVSLKGIQLHDLPARFYSIQEEKFTVIISNLFDSIHYKLKAYSKWRKVNGRSVAVGLHLVDAPTAWNKLINMIIPENDFEPAEEGAWDQYTAARV